MTDNEIRPICQHLGTKVHYEFLGGNKFRNIVTGQSGEVDEEKAAKVYEGYKPLIAKDIAETIYFVTSRPNHVNINDLVIMPTAQASAFYWNKNL